MNQFWRRKSQNKFSYSHIYLIPCLFSLALADTNDSDPIFEPFAAPNCQKQSEIRTRLECTPTTEKVCSKKTKQMTSYVTERVCKDVITKKCDNSPKLPRNPYSYSKNAWKPIGSKQHCYEVTTKDCSEVPKEVVIPKEYEECELVKKEHCNPVHYKVYQTICSPITECPPGFIIKTISDTSEVTKRQCVRPDFRVECDQLNTTCDPQIEGLYRDRREIEAENAKNIEMINGGDNTWTAGKTSLSNLAYSEVLAYWTGEIPPPMEQVTKRDVKKEKFLAQLEIKRQTRNKYRVIVKSKGYAKRKRQIQGEPDKEVFSTDANNQGGCAACSAFAVSAAMETCVHRAMLEYVPLNTASGSDNSFPVAPPGGLSSQNILDCAFDRNDEGQSGCDGAQSYRYLAWLKSVGGSLDTSRQYPYIDGNIQFEGLSGDYRQCYQNMSRPTTAVLDETYNSWDNHTERDLENILLDGHAIISTMFVTKNFQLVRSGVYRDPLCQDWMLGNNRFSQWEANSGFMPLRHTVVIVGFGEENGQKYWKVKNSWGENWGSSGYFKIIRNGKAHCGLGAYFSVALCRRCPEGGCEPPNLSSQGAPPDSRAPPNLPDQGIAAGLTSFLANPVSGVSEVSCGACVAGGVGSGQGVQQNSQCPPLQFCKVQDDSGQSKCCRPREGSGNRLYCPSRC